MITRGVLRCTQDDALASDSIGRRELLPPHDPAKGGASRSGARQNDMYSGSIPRFLFIYIAQAQ